MRYIHVRWLHEHPDEPVDLYSELTGDGWEVRKVEIVADGSATLRVKRVAVQPAAQAKPHSLHLPKSTSILSLGDEP